MVGFRAVPTTDAAARELLDEYFAGRAATFPTEMGEYQTTLPNPEEFSPPGGVFLVVEDETPAGAADIGCGGIRWLGDAARPTRFEVKHLWVQPHARGRGIGRLLLDELEARARLLGASTLLLDTNVAQEAASQLYRRSGYVEIAPYNRNPNATHWFAKDLCTPAS